MYLKILLSVRNVEQRYWMKELKIEWIVACVEC